MKEFALSLKASGRLFQNTGAYSEIFFSFFSGQKSLFPKKMKKPENIWK